MTIKDKLVYIEKEVGRLRKSKEDSNEVQSFLGIIGEFIDQYPEFVRDLVGLDGKHETKLQVAEDHPDAIDFLYSKLKP